MAIKGDRNIVETSINYICNTVASKGQVLVYGPTNGSGSAISDDKSGTVQLVSNPSGYTPVGPLLANFVSIDQTRQHRNFNRDEQVIGEKAPLLRQGWLTTNQVIGTPTPGQPAYLSSSGNVTNVLHATGGLVATPHVGEFQSALDEDGYARVQFHMPY